MSESRTIKKYPNRRLYDTADSRYITLEDIKRLVREGVEFRVMDARSEEDLTRNILLQVISDQEERGEPILSTELLQQIIRFYGDTMQGLITNYLENSLRAFVEQQNAFRDQLRVVMGPTPMSMLVELAERNFAMWRNMQESFLRAVLPDAQTERTGEPEAKPPPQPGPNKPGPNKPGPNKPIPPKTGETR
jgi:polyhydroxyalkanoate synthesis repressor PhaR